MLPLPVPSKLSAKLLRTIDARREATGDQGIGSAIVRDILDRELAELALEWMMNPQSPATQTCHEYADLKFTELLRASRSDGPPEPTLVSCRLERSLPTPTARSGRLPSQRKDIEGQIPHDHLPPHRGRRGGVQTGGLRANGCLGLVAPASPPAALSPLPGRYRRRRTTRSIFTMLSLEFARVVCNSGNCIPG